MTNLEQHYRTEIVHSIDAAMLGRSKLTAFHLAMDGMSSMKGRHFLNNLLHALPYLSDRRARYLEVGSWKGSTLCAATFSNDIDAIAIENFSQFTDITVDNRDARGPRDALVSNININRMFSKPQFSATILDNDAFAVDPTGLGLFDVYFYDGEHTYDAHYKAFTHFAPALQSTFIAIVDDYRNLPEDGTHQATQAAFKDLGWKVAAEWFLYDECDGSPGQKMEQGWWNGMYVAVVSKGGAAK